MMNGKQKIYFLLDRIVDERDLTPSGQPIKLHPSRTLNSKFYKDELIRILTKLEKDSKILKLVQFPGVAEAYLMNDEGYFVIELLSKFDDYYANIQLDPEYQEFTGKKPSQSTESTDELDTAGIQRLYKKIADVDEQITIRRNALAKAQLSINDNPMYSEATRVGQLAKLEQQAQVEIGNFIKQKETYLTELTLKKAGSQLPQSYTAQVDEFKKANTSQIIYEITFSQKTGILLNRIQISKPDFDSENERVFSFLYENPNKKHSRNEIEKALNQPLTKSLHKIIENLGFKGDIKRAFIDVTKDAICFRNPLIQEDFEKLGIPKIKFPK